MFNKLKDFDIPVVVDTYRDIYNFRKEESNMLWIIAIVLVILSFSLKRKGQIKGDSKKANLWAWACFALAILLVIGQLTGGGEEASTNNETEQSEQKEEDKAEAEAKAKEEEEAEAEAEAKAKAEEEAKAKEEAEAKAEEEAKAKKEAEEAKASVIEGYVSAVEFFADGQGVAVQTGDVEKLSDDSYRTSIVLGDDTTVYAEANTENVTYVNIQCSLNENNGICVAIAMAGLDSGEELANGFTEAITSDEFIQSLSTNGSASGEFESSSYSGNALIDGYSNDVTVSVNLKQ